MAAAMIMNSNSLPVALLQSLAATVPGLHWGQDDTLDAIVGRAITYLLLCGTMGQFVSLSLCFCVVTHPATTASLELWGASTLQGGPTGRDRVQFAATR
jgi:predicted permease